MRVMPCTGSLCITDQDPDPEFCILASALRVKGTLGVAGPSPTWRESLVAAAVTVLTRRRPLRVPLAQAPWKIVIRDDTNNSLWWGRVNGFYSPTDNRVVSAPISQHVSPKPPTLLLPSLTTSPLTRPPATRVTVAAWTRGGVSQGLVMVYFPEVSVASMHWVLACRTLFWYSRIIQM